MIKVITAINNPKINEKLKENEEIEILSKDICYQEGIFEILEKYNEINYIIINKKIFGRMETGDLINKIKEKNNKIKIILYVENEKEMIYNQNICKTVNKNIEIENLIKIMKNEKIEIKEESKKIITILGTGGIGRSTFSIILAKTISKNEKILISDVNANIRAICGQNMKNRIDKKIDIRTKEINFEGSYKYVIIDTYTLNRKIIENTDLFILLLGGNLIEIKKAENLLKMYKNRFKLKNIKLVINKYTQNCMDYEVIKNIFSDYKIIGKIDYKQDYDLLINKKMKKINKEIKKDYNSIIKKLKGEEIWN